MQARSRVRRAVFAVCGGVFAHAHYRFRKRALLVPSRCDLMWSEGKLDDLIHEGRTIQHQLIRGQKSLQQNDDQTSRRFAKLMMEGKVRAALRLVTQANSSGPLPLNNLANPNDPNSTQTVRDILLEKHPPKQPPRHSSIIKPHVPLAEPHPVLFEKINGQLIQDTVLRMDGAAGPSGLDATSWKHLCTSFKGASTKLCESSQLLQDECVHVMWIPVVFQPSLLAVLSLWINAQGKTYRYWRDSRRMIGRAIAKILSDDIQMAVGPLQLCAGHQSGCESAVHAMRQVFESSETEAIILVDATNAFNSLNRQTALRNIQHLCPALSKVLINTYRDDVRLYINGETMLSQEGTTQGIHLLWRCMP